MHNLLCGLLYVYMRAGNAHTERFEASARKLFPPWMRVL